MIPPVLLFPTKKKKKKNLEMMIWHFLLPIPQNLLCMGLGDISDKASDINVLLPVTEKLLKIDPFSPSASFYHHLCQVYWCGWQRTPLRWLMNKPMIIFNNRKAWGLGKILTVGGITKSLHRKSLVILLLWVTHDTRRTCVRVELGLTL